MSNYKEKFERFRQEHARLHDPALVSGAVEFVPVELSEVMSGIVRGGKKKKRHGVRAGKGASKVASRTRVEPPAGERLFPSGFIRKLGAQVSGKLAHEGALSENQQGKPYIEIEPPSVKRNLNLFQEQSFALDAPAAQQVELVWHEETGTPTHRSHAMLRDTAQPNTTLQGELQRVVMDHREADRFETQIGIVDGAYLFAFVVDGYLRPDTRFAQRVLLGGDGLFAPRTLARHEQTLTLTSKSESAERVRLEASAPWLIPEQTQIDLPARSSVELTVRFHLPTMLAGVNEGVLRLSVEREEGEATAGIIHFAVQVDVGGAVPEISLAPREFGEIKQGLDEPQLWVEITARGRGPLTGMISLPHSGELADFQLNAGDDDDVARFAHTFYVESANLPQPQPHRTEAALKIMLITDSFLANYRLCRAEIPYRLVHLKKSLPALSFGTVRAGGTKSMRLEVERSDKQEIELNITLPADVAPYLEAYQARANAYVFRLDTHALSPGTSISETIELIDCKSGLRDQIKVFATVTRTTDESFRAVVSSGNS